MGLWVWNRMHYRTYVKKDGTQEERRTHPGNAIIFTGLTRQGIQLPKGQLEKLGFGLKGALETPPISRLLSLIHI